MMPPNGPTIFPKHLQQNINKLKRDIVNIENKVEAIKRQNEGVSKGKENKGIKTPLKGKQPTLMSRCDSSSCHQDQLKKNSCKCCGHRYTQTNLPGVCQVDTKIFSKDHVHHTIRIPADNLLMKKRSRSGEKVEKPKSIPNPDNKTWGEILKEKHNLSRQLSEGGSPSPGKHQNQNGDKRGQQNDVRVRAVKRAGDERSLTTKATHENSGEGKVERAKDENRSTRREAQKSFRGRESAKDEVRKGDKKQELDGELKKKKRKVIAETVALLQEEIRKVLAEKDAAVREALKCTLAADKMKALLETNIAFEKHRTRSIEMTTKHIDEEMKKVRFDSVVQVAAALDQFRAFADSPLTVGTGSSGSRRIRHSSPTPSKEPYADATEASWNEFSSIQEISFSTI